MSEERLLLEAPYEATAALEDALRGCLRPTYFGKYPFATYTQQQELSKHLNSDYLTEFEFKWVHFMRVYFNAATADEVNRQLARIIEHRRAIGPLPVPASRYYPESFSIPSTSSRP